MNVALPPPRKEKIDLKTIGYVFIGYVHNNSAYQFIVYESTIPEIHQNTYIESINASFFKYIFSYRSSG